MADSGILDTDEHFLECATCINHSEFYCNTCNQRMCNECRETHLKEKKNANHNVGLYRERGKLRSVDKLNDEIGKHIGRIKSSFQELLTTKKRETKESKPAKFQSPKLNSNRSVKKFNFEKLKTITVLNLKIISHLSMKTSELIWASDEKGNLVHFDVDGNLVQKMCTCESKAGYHTVNKEGNLLYTDGYMQTIYIVIYKGSEISETPVLTTEEWLPWCIYSSAINEDILLGMKKAKEWKMSKYNMKGKKLMDIQKDAGGRKLYQSISYVTENVNGDICSSDYLAGKVVVVNLSGEYQFSYSGHNSEGVYTPYGICTDVQGHIVVCSSVYCGNDVCHSIHLLAQDGQFLSLLPLSGQCPRAICVDNQHNIYVATERSTVMVYKYTQSMDE